MSTPVAYPVSSTQVGLAIETTKGTAVAPTFWFPVRSPKYKPDIKFLPDETLQGSMVEIYDEIPGLRWDTHGWDSYPYLDSFPLLLRALLGSTDSTTAAPTSTTLAASVAAGSSSVSATGSVAAGSFINIGSGMTIEAHLTTAVSGAGPYSVTLASPMLNNQASGASVTGLTKHQFSLLNNAAATGNQPPGVTITDFDGEEWRQLAGGTLDTLTLKGTADALDGYTVSWFGNAATTPTTPTPSYTTTQAPPGWTVQASLGGTFVKYLVDWEFSFKRGVKAVPGITGTQAPFMLWAGPLVPSLKITVIEQSGAPQFAAYEGATNQSMDFTLSDIKSGYALNLHSTDAKYTTAELVRSNASEWVQATFDVELLPSASDATAGGVSQVLASVGNGQTSAY